MLFSMLPNVFSMAVTNASVRIYKREFELLELDYKNLTSITSLITGA